MSNERVGEQEGPRADWPPATTEAAHGDGKAQRGDESLSRLAPADLATVRAIIDAALARRS